MFFTYLESQDRQQSSCTEKYLGALEADCIAQDYLFDNTTGPNTGVPVRTVAQADARLVKYTLNLHPVALRYFWTI